MWYFLYYPDASGLLNQILLSLENIVGLEMEDLPYLILKDKSLFTMPLVVYRLKEDASVTMSMQMLCLILSSIPGFLIFALFQKHIVGGINVGGVKG